MKKFTQLLVAGLMLGSAIPVFAGPDWATIELARKAKQTASVQQQAEAPASAAASAPASAQPAHDHMTCPPPAPSKQLDHGPRATTSPYITAKRQAEYEAAQQACRDAGM